MYSNPFYLTVKDSVKRLKLTISLGTYRAKASPSRFLLFRPFSKVSLTSFGKSPTSSKGVVISPVSASMRPSINDVPIFQGGGALCVEMGFMWTFPRNQDATVKLKSELISIKF